MDHFKVFIELVTILLMFHVVGFLAERHVRSQLIESTPPALESEVLTTEPPGKSSFLSFLIYKRVRNLFHRVMVRIK